MNRVFHAETIELARFTEHRARQSAGVLRGPQEVDFLVPRDPEQEAEPAVLPVARNQCRFVDNEGEVPASAHAISRAGDELSKPGELRNHVDLEGAIADAKPLPVVGGLWELFKCGDFIAVIFSAPVPD